MIGHTGHLAFVLLTWSVDIEIAQTDDLGADLVQMSAHIVIELKL